MTMNRAFPIALLATLASCSSRAPIESGTSSPRAAVVPARPRPYPVFEDTAFRRAVALGTRTRTGAPGPRYWQQHAEYRLRATLDSATRRISGEGTVRYHNRSPDALRTI